MAEKAVDWFHAPPGWSPDQPNPFSPDGAYGAGWSCFRLTDDDDDWLRNGCEPSGLYVVRLGRRCEHITRRLGDFLRYECAHGRRVIVAGTAEISPEALVARALAETPEPDLLRDDDPPWMVHSTTPEAWAAIEACGELRAFAILRGGTAQRAIGEALLNDPPDYAEHIALGEIEKIGPEFVVACRQAGRMLPDPDTEYEPGVRLYFDAHRIIRDGLAVRDGLHTLKVRDRLPLNPYLAAAIGPADVPPLPDGERWTTTRFRDCANEAFVQRLGERHGRG
ncbi:hypothetical protein LLH23_04135 [bacterium]|nr:hypothetical protein [bacterium]